MDDCLSKSCTRSFRRLGLGLCLAAVLLSACKESVDTRLEITHPFSLFGLINPKADTHAVRVFEIKGEIELIRVEPINAHVRSTLMQTGEQQAWRDSVVQLAGRNYRHVYWTTFTALAGETYKLEVIRSDGETSTAITTVPPPVNLDVLEPDTLTRNQALMPVLIRGRPPALPRIDVEYVVVGFREEGSDPVFKPLTFNYVGRPAKVDDGWLLEIDLIDDFSEIYKAFDDDSNVTTDVIDLREIRLSVHVGDENWVSPAGVFDADLLAEPGLFSNVDNGFGYFGSGYVESVVFRPPHGTHPSRRILRHRE